MEKEKAELTCSEIEKILDVTEAFWANDSKVQSLRLLVSELKFRVSILERRLEGPRGPGIRAAGDKRSSI